MRNRVNKKLACMLTAAALISSPLTYLHAALGANVHAVQDVQQAFTVNGQVFDQTGESVIGASVLLKGTTIGTVTDLDGRFKLDIPSDGVLVISFVGYKTVEVKVSRTSREVKVVMEDDSEVLDDVVVIGYGTVKKSDLTGSVTSVKSEDMLKRNPIDVGQGLQGLAAGVQVMRNSGDPRGGTTIRIRGVATVNGSADPLYVVDGVQVGTNIDFLNPSDIESIEVMKDASATAIYGSRGANGVIMITTKKGKQGDTKVDITANWAVSSNSSTLDVGTMSEFVKAVRGAKANDGAAFTQLAWANPQYDNQYNNIDWQKQMTRSALQQNYNVSISGGNEKTQSRLSVGYLDNEGIVVASNFQRFTARLNATYKIKDFIQASGSVSFVHGRYAGSGNAYSFAAAIPSMDHLDENGQFVHVPIQYANGTWGHYLKESDGDTEKGTDNLYAAAMERDSRTHFNRVLANANLDIDIFKGLKHHTVLSYHFNNVQTDTYTPENHRTFITDTNPDKFSLSNKNSRTIAVETYFTYDLTLGSHRLGAMAGYSASKTRSEDLYGIGYALPADVIRRIELTTTPSSRNVTGGYGIPVNFVSWYGRLNYSLKDRYLLTATVRHDGSSNFGAGNRWGTFPSASLAWRLSEEKFIKDLNIFSNLKLRLGWGQTGNAGGATSLSVEQLTSKYMMYYFFINGQTTNAPGIAKPTEIDTNLKWETNEQTNIGIDLGFLNGKLNISLDYFIRTAKDLLLYKNIRPSTGFDNVYTNAGKIRNKGFEFSINYNTQIGKDWTFRAALNGSTLTNEAVEVGDDIYCSENIDTGYYWENYSITRNGHPVGAFYGWQVEGIFRSQKEVDEANSQAAKLSNGAQNYRQDPNTRPGDYKFRDLNGDGIINDSDRSIIGNGYPKLNYGLTLGASYKSFDFSMNLIGVLGQDILSYSAARLTTIYNPRGGYQNGLSEYLNNTWNEQNVNAPYTRLTRKDENHNVRVSDAYIKNGDFLKIANLQVGYTLPKSWVKAAKLESVRVSLSVDNLLTISGYNKYGNPEIGNSNVLQSGFDSGRYPFPRAFNLGLGVQF